jgi:hypothetical protein
MGAEDRKHRPQRVVAGLAAAVPEWTASSLLNPTRSSCQSRRNEARISNARMGKLR